MSPSSVQKAFPARLIIAWVLGLAFVFGAYILDGLEAMIMALGIVALAAIVFDRLGALGKR